jgi:hypothetical protein
MPTLHCQPDKMLVVCYVLETRPFGGKFGQVKSAGVNPVSLMSYVRIDLHCSTQQACILPQNSADKVVFTNFSDQLGIKACISVLSLFARYN